jgi:4-amino-4-deoxy-L-arabinose transferase-like glycosyltransferase
VKNKKLITIFILIVAIGVAFATRFYLLGQAPKGLYLDEAGQGYSAYSILKTGKDEFGKSFPIVFRSFTDFKTPVYVYLIVPLIPVFGLTAFTVRFPSFFFSILTIPVLYLLINEIGNKLDKKEKIKIWSISLISILLLSISPWHILFGRTNFECNVALFFFLTGCLLFYIGLKKPKVLVLSAILFAIAIPAYHAQRIVTPLMILVLFIRHRKTLLDKSHIKYLIIGGVFAFIISLPTLSIATTSGFLARANGLNIFTVKKSAGVLENYHGPFSFIVNNKIFLSLQEFGSLYTSYFSPRDMFVLGDSGPRSSFPEIGTFFIWQFPFYIYGLYLIVKKRELGELRFFTIAFLLIAPIPAALTRDPYSTIRSLQMVIPLTILIAIAIIETVSKLKKRNWKIIFWIGFAGLIIYSILKLYSSVIILNEHYRGVYWNYGWQMASEEIKKFDKNLPIVVDNSRDEPYIQLAFFLKEDPIQFQKDNYEIPLSQYYSNMNRNKNKVVGNIVTRPINWEKDLLIKQYLIGDELAISLQQIKEHNLTLIKEIKYPDGKVAIRITETNPTHK